MKNVPSLSQEVKIFIDSQEGTLRSWKAQGYQQFEIQAGLQSVAQANDIQLSGQWYKYFLTTMGAISQSISAKDYLNAAEGQSVITSKMVGMAPWARSGSEFSLAPKWRLDYQVLNTENPSAEPTWQSMYFYESLPDTKDTTIMMATSNAMSANETSFIPEFSIGDLDLYQV